MENSNELTVAKKPNFWQRLFSITAYNEANLDLIIRTEKVKEEELNIQKQYEIIAAANADINMKKAGILKKEAMLRNREIALDKRENAISLKELQMQANNNTNQQEQVQPQQQEQPNN